MSLVVKRYTASWCGPCQMLKPVFNELAENYSSENIIFEVIDIDDNQNEAVSAGVRSVPTVVLEKDGVEVERFVGVQSKFAYINSITENSK